MFICTKFKKSQENLIGSQLVLCKLSWSLAHAQDLIQVIGYYTDSYLLDDELSNLKINLNS